VAEVWQALRRRRELARNTVQTTLSRLHERGWLRCRNSNGTFIYSAAHPRKITVRRMVGRLIDTAFGGSAEGLVLSLLEEGRLSRAEAARIRELIHKAQREGR
jgi:predicted transcriptional regulator